jgi:hypothetical protein
MKFPQVFRYWILLIFSLPLFLFAKSPKPKILIYGSTLEAYVAALQSAASGVPTLWVNPQGYSFEQDRKQIVEENELKALDGGVIFQFIKKQQDPSDSTNLFQQNEKRQSYNELTADNLLLTSTIDADVVKIEGGKTWKVTLSNKKKYDVISVLDASVGSTLLQKTTLRDFPSLKYTKAKELKLADSRAAVLVGEIGGDIYVSTLSNLLTQKDNFFVANLQNFTVDVDKSFRMSYAQVMGAVAGYCAFFKTTADKIDLRTLQNELLMYRGRLLPTADVHVEDKNFIYLQRMYLAGILPLRVEDGNPVFDKEDSVRVSDIKSIINQFYSRAQLWFVDNNPEFLTVQDALNLIKFTAFRGEELDIEVKKKWNKELTFKGDYDPSKVISRYEFSVLFDMYASPFVKKVSLDGATIYR